MIRGFVKIVFLFYVLNMLFVGSSPWIHKAIVKYEPTILSAMPEGAPRMMMNLNLEVIKLGASSGIALQKMTGDKVKSFFM